MVVPDSSRRSQPTRKSSPLRQTLVLKCFRHHLLLERCPALALASELVRLEAPAECADPTSAASGLQVTAALLSPFLQQLDPASAASTRTLATTRSDSWPNMSKSRSLSSVYVRTT